MVGIKDFEMPKACYACPISDEWTGHCTIVGNEKIDKDTGRQINCPLVEFDSEVEESAMEGTAIFDADERADIMNAINDAFYDMGYIAVGYDDTNGVWMDVFIQKQ